MVEKVKSAWDAIPPEVQTWARRGAFAGTLVTALLTGGAVSGVVTSQSDPRIERVIQNDARQDTALARLEAGQPKTDYLFCVDLADRRLTTRTPQDCFEDYATPGVR